MSIIDNFNNLEVVFSSADARLHYPNKNSLAAALDLAINKGYIKRIKRDCYAMIDLATGEPYANKFQIASKLSKDAVVSHISAFQFHGLYNQVSYNVHYTTISRNREVTFEDNNYICHAPNLKNNRMGTIYDKWNGTRVTDIERSILDSIYSVNKVGGLKELIDILGMLPQLNKSNMVDYLEAFRVNKTFIQRLGFLLEEFLNVKCSDELIQYLLEKKGNSPKYLLSIKEVQKGQTIYMKKWN